MNTFALRTAIAPLVALGAGVASADPTLHGDPDTPGTQLTSHSNSPHSFSCGAIPFFGSGPVQGGCVGDDGSISFPAGHAH
ncbi:hypothetical protein EEB14_49345 [Rhodococcus sp. WS4]|nr:hypothetical protein EEB14_49345 [Rhodococcus sp. WS4]